MLLTTVTYLQHCSCSAILLALQVTAPQYFETAATTNQTKQHLIPEGFEPSAVLDSVISWHDDAVFMCQLKKPKLPNSVHP
jgi:hypothetical protein